MKGRPVFGLPRDRRRRTLLGQHGDDRLADSGGGEQLLDVVVGVRIGARRSTQRLLVVRGEGPQRVLDPVAQLRQDVAGDVLG